MGEPPPPPAHHFAPIDPHSHVTVLGDRFDDRFVEDADYFVEERKPSVQQRFDRMALEDDLDEIQPRSGRSRLSDDLGDYQYFRLVKRGDDWSAATKTTITATTDEIEKRIKKSRSTDDPVRVQLDRMSPLRKDMIDEILEKANKDLPSDEGWEVACIKAKKQQTRKGRIEVPEMELILSRTLIGSRPRGKSITRRKGEKERRYTNDTSNRPRKDSVLDKLEDPVANLPLFDNDGTPRDELGAMHFNNANLPPQIPREVPLGYKPEKKKDKKDKDGKGGKSRSKSRDRDVIHEDDLHPGDFLADDPPPIDDLFSERKHEKRGRRTHSPHEHPSVVDDEHRRSHSRHRHPEQREKSRRRDSVHYPNNHTAQYFGGSASSENSDATHYGFDYAESSNTSLSTPGGVPRRGSMAHPQGRPEVVYRKHHPGPSRRKSYIERPYHGDQHVIAPPRRRNSYIVADRPPEGRYERPPRLVRQYTTPIPEHRQIGYIDTPRESRSGELVPMRRYSTYDSSVPPILHYPEDDRDAYYEVDRQSVRAEDYQRNRVLDAVRRAEDEIGARERDIEIREDELRRLRRQRDQEYYEDRRERRQSRRVYVDPVTGDHFYYE